jgi:hypothetical protein
MNKSLKPTTNGADVMKSYNLESGSYYIGDPCYVLGHNNDYWDRMSETCTYFQTHRDGIYTINDFDGKPHKVAFFDTNGDGGFPASDDCEYSVDSGTLSCIPSTFVYPPQCLGPLGIVFSGCGARIHTLPSEYAVRDHYEKEMKAQDKQNPLKKGEVFRDVSKTKSILPPLMFKVGKENLADGDFILHFGDLAIRLPEQDWLG